jgi:predicted phage gp36 major capsid-like protein
MTQVVINLEALGVEQAAWIAQAAEQRDGDLSEYATTLLGEVITRQMTRPTKEQLRQSAMAYGAWLADRPPADLLDEAAFEAANGIALAKTLRHQAAEHAARQPKTDPATTPITTDEEDFYRQWLRGCTNEAVTGLLATQMDAVADLPGLLGEVRRRGLVDPPAAPIPAEADGVVLLRPSAREPAVAVSLREWAAIRDATD